MGLSSKDEEVGSDKTEQKLIVTTIEDSEVAVLTFKNNMSKNLDPLLIAEVLDNVLVTTGEMFKMKDTGVETTGISVYKVSTPVLNTELFLMSKENLKNVLDTHEELMSNIPEDANELNIEINKTLEFNFNIIKEIDKEGIFDYFAFIVTSDSDLDSEKYIRSIDIQPIAEYINLHNNINKN